MQALRKAILFTALPVAAMIDVATGNNEYRLPYVCVCYMIVATYLGQASSGSTVDPAQFHDIEAGATIQANESMLSLTAHSGGWCNGPTTNTSILVDNGTYVGSLSKDVLFDLTLKVGIETGLALGAADETKSNAMFFLSLLVIVAMAMLVIVRRQMSRVIPTTERLGEDLARPLPWIIRLIGLVLDNKVFLSLWNPWDVTNADKLMKKGALQAGLAGREFPPAIKENLRVLCQSFVEDKVEFHWVGRLNMHDTIVTGLSYYLRLQEVFAANPELGNVKLNDPIVIAGLPRSGTTLTHNLLSQDPNALFLPLWQHFYPVKLSSSIFDTRRIALKTQFCFWKWISNTYGLDSVHFLEPDLPDECIFSLRIGGPSVLYWNLAPVYSYMNWLMDPEKGQKFMYHSYEVYRQILQLVQSQNPGKRLVLKCPSHSLTPNILAKVIPEANIVFTHRDPRTLPASSGSLITRLHASSVSRQDWWRTTRFNTQKHFHFGRNLAHFAQTSSRKVFHSPYTELTKSPVDLIRRLYHHFDLSFSLAHEEAIMEYLSKNHQGSRGRHRYSTAYLGLHPSDAETAFNDYFDAFAEYLPPKKAQQSNLLSDETQLHDVIVVGGGVSGLSAAQQCLDRSNGKAKVLVLEANDCVGGRLKTASNDAGSDLGGGYIGPTQDRILRLSQNLGIQTHFVYNKGDIVFRNSESGNILRGSIDLPPLGIVGLLDFNSILVKFEALASRINREDPMNSSLPKGVLPQELDHMTVKEWIDSNATSEAVKEMFPRVVDTLLCKSAEDVSMLYFLWYARSADTLKRLMNTANGAQERKLVGGASLVPQRMAEKLGSTVVRLNCVVKMIDQQTNEGFVSVVCHDGRCFRASRVVMAMPPPIYKSISWKPKLPPSKQAVVQSMGWGHIIKTVLYFKRAWWRDQNSNGQIWDTKGPVLYSMDDSKPDDSYPALMGFILGDDAKKWRKLDPIERKAAISKQYAELFKTNEALEPIDYIECDWSSEKFTEGSAVALPRIGSFCDTNKNIRKSFDKVFFAGTECASVWSGYMDGAIQAGEAAADEALESFMEKSAIVAIEQALPIASPSAAPGVFEVILALLFDTFYKGQFVRPTKRADSTNPMRLIKILSAFLIGLIATSLIASSIPLPEPPNSFEREAIRLGQADFARTPLSHVRMPWYFEEEHTDLLAVEGKVALVTGSSTGVGAAVAVELCKKNIGTVIVTSRSFARAQNATNELLTSQTCDADQVIPMELDLTDQDSIRTFARGFLAHHKKLDFFVQNAGMWMKSPQDHGQQGQPYITKSGHEYMYASNYLGHFLLTQLLMDAVQASDGARIVVVSSVSQWGAKANLTSLLPSSEVACTSLEEASFGEVLQQYGNTKFLQMAMSFELQRRLGQDSNVTVIPLTPGYTDTDIGSSQRKGGKLAGSKNSILGIAPHQGAQTTLHALLSPSLKGTQGYFLQPYWTPPHRSVVTWLGFLLHSVWWEVLLQTWTWAPYLQVAHPHAYSRDFGSLLWEQSSIAVGLTNERKAAYVKL